MSGNAVIYCRISSKGQAEGGGLGSQETSCRNYCERQGYDVVDVFKDTFTGGELDRPGLNRLFEFIDKAQKENQGGITHFIAEDINRIARDYMVHMQIKTELLRKGIKYETVNMRFEDTPAGKMIEGVMAVNAQFFRDENQARVISRQEARLLDGYRPFFAPTGYTFAKAKAGGRVLVPDYPNARIIKEGLEGYADGVFSSIGDVAEFFQEEGLDLSRNGGRSPGRKIGKGTAGKILNNILYSGKIEYKKTTHNKDGTIKKVWDISLRDGKHEGLISYKYYLKIKSILESKKPYQHSPQNENEDFPLRRFLVCECCGLHMSSGFSKGKYKSYPYYQFNKKCVNVGKSVRADLLQKKLSTDLFKIKLDERLMDLLRSMILEEFDRRNNGKRDNNTDLIKSIEEVDGEIDNLINLLSNSTSNSVRENVTKRIEILDRKKKSLEAELEEFEDNSILPNAIDIAFKTLDNIYSIRNYGTLREQQRVLRLLLNGKIKVNSSQKSYGTLPFTSLLQLFQDISNIVSTNLEVRRIELRSKRHTHLVLPL